VKFKNFGDLKSCFFFKSFTHILKNHCYFLLKDSEHRSLIFKILFSIKIFFIKLPIKVNKIICQRIDRVNITLSIKINTKKDKFEFLKHIPIFKTSLSFVSAPAVAGRSVKLSGRRQGN